MIACTLSELDDFYAFAKERTGQDASNLSLEEIVRQWREVTALQDVKRQLDAADRDVAEGRLSSAEDTFAYVRSRLRERAEDQK